MAKHAPSAAVITDARAGQSKDIHRRQRNYLISMAVRTGCFLALVLIQHPVRWVFLLGALVLPMVAVMLVNESDRRGQTTVVEHPEPETHSAVTSHVPEDVITGEIDETEQAEPVAHRR